MKRPVTFVLWPNGYQHCEKILEIIAQHPKFEVVRIVKIRDYNIRWLTRSVYKNDKVNPLHISGKIKYLQKMDGPIHVILCYEENPDLIIRGEKYDIIDSQCVMALKGQIRERFNSRDNAGMISDDHVIHSSDNDDEALRLIHLVDPQCLNGLAFTRQGIHGVERPDLSKGVEAKRRIEFQKELSLDSLRAVILQTGSLQKLYLPITRTPHYQYLHGDIRPYLDYIQEHRGHAHRCFYGPHKFNKLLDIGKRDLTLLRSISVVRRDNNYHIVDGLHRACIAHFLGSKKINCEVCFDH
ncbi:hypothetical protein N9J60_00620 [Alphaproteobacteria bacterium]|nr:hypothetical protein [Alphaproteobacteria bacterium]